MSVHYAVPKGAIFSRKLPTKGKLPVSQLITGAFAHSFELSNGALRVQVTFHAKVDRYSELAKTQKWIIAPCGEPGGPRADFLLVPAKNDAKVEFLGICVHPDLGVENGLLIHFDTVEEVHGRKQTQRESSLANLRRVRAATHAASRL